MKRQARAAARKSLWIMLTALVVVIGVPSARADSFTDGTIHFMINTSFGPTTTSFVFDNTTNAFTSFTVMAPGPEVFDFVPTGITLAELDTSGTWSLTTFRASNPDQLFILGAGGGHAESMSNVIGVTGSDSTQSGTYTVIETTVAAPDSGSTLILLGLGILALVVTQRRMSHTSRPAA